MTASNSNGIISPVTTAASQNLPSGPPAFVTPPALLAQLDAIDPQYDFTRGDEIVLTLSDLIKCPILLEASFDMIVFNNQCYNTQSFMHHKQGKMCRNKRRISSGYSGQTRLKDHRTRENFNYFIAMNQKYFENIKGEKLALMLFNQI